jgi:nicotinate-nucleotide pyrophosphorylase (carboxylating)
MTTTCMKKLKAYLDVRNQLLNFLREDVGSGDITSESIISSNTSALAHIICKSKKKAIVSGLYECGILFGEICKCDTKILVEDGSTVNEGNVVMQVRGKARSILRAERTALNIMMRMSGISTLTNEFVCMVKDYDKSVRIACTRKTSPGMRIFDKKAVELGGGKSHRLRLDDMVLIKDNHLLLTGSVERSIKIARKSVGSAIRIECEVGDPSQIISAIKRGADIVMLDNFSPEEVKESIHNITKLGLRDKAMIEVSGGISLNNIKDYASAEPDIISIGSLTHSAKAIDFSLEIIKVIGQSPEPNK